ncbi:hypothetical protein NL108_009081 [Boleophthalmus pectinirostris]|nr:hypothetical protein NL108_009081 [Boleophthalmus pectinirostris]
MQRLAGEIITQDAPLKWNSAWEKAQGERSPTAAHANSTAPSVDHALQVYFRGYKLHMSRYAMYQSPLTSTGPICELQRGTHLSHTAQHLYGNCFVGGYDSSGRRGASGSYDAQCVQFLA